MNGTGARCRGVQSDAHHLVELLSQSAAGRTHLTAGHGGYNLIAMPALFLVPLMQH